MKNKKRNSAPQVTLKSNSISLFLSLNLIGRPGMSDTKLLLCKLHWNAIGFLAGGKGQTAEDELRENLGEIPKLAECRLTSPGKPVTSLPYCPDQIATSRPSQMAFQSKGFCYLVQAILFPPCVLLCSYSVINYGESLGCAMMCTMVPSFFFKIFCWTRSLLLLASFHQLQ